MADELKVDLSTLQPGAYLAGFYLGREPGRTYVPRGSTEERTIKPSIGLKVGDQEVAIRAKDEGAADAATKHLVKGDPAIIMVDPMPPFGSRGDVEYVLPGTFEGRAKRQWR